MRAASIRTRLPLLLAVGLVPAVIAQAQTPRRPAVDVTSLQGTLALGSVLERSGSHGCSQSYASSDHRAAMQLAVEGTDAATLTIDLQHHETFGPSPGRYAEGDHDVQHTTELGRAVLSGTVERSADALVFRFRRMRESHVRIRGFGTVPLPPPTESTIDFGLRCERAPLDVLPSAPSANERPTRATLLRCTHEGSLLPLAPFEAQSPVFGQGAGVRSIERENPWGDETTRELRLAP